jgi:hypothetical protein
LIDKTRQILGTGNEDGELFVEIKLRTGSACKVVFDPSLTPELIGALQRRRQRLSARRLKQEDKNQISRTSIWC